MKRFVTAGAGVLAAAAWCAGARGQTVYFTYEDGSPSLRELAYRPPAPGDTRATLTSNINVTLLIDTQEMGGSGVASIEAAAAIELECRPAMALGPVISSRVDGSMTLRTADANAAPLLRVEIEHAVLAVFASSGAGALTIDFPGEANPPQFVRTLVYPALEAALLAQTGVAPECFDNRLTADAMRSFNFAVSGIQPLDGTSPVTLVNVDGSLFIEPFDCNHTYSGQAIGLGAGHAPIITQEPQDAVANVGGEAQFVAAAEMPGSGAGGGLAYRWRHDGEDLADTRAVSGAATPVLTLTSLQPSDAGVYECVVSNECGAAVSRAATLDVQPIGGCPGDEDGSGAVGFTDLNRVLGNFGQSGAPGVPGDDDLDGDVDFDDLNRVLGNFGNVC